jgi:hypothetical protein
LAEGRTGEAVQSYSSMAGGGLSLVAAAALTGPWGVGVGAAVLAGDVLATAIDIYSAQTTRRAARQQRHEMCMLFKAYTKIHLRGGYRVRLQ